MIEIPSASISNLGAILSSSFVREPRTAAFDGAAGEGDGGADAMKRFVHGKHVLCLREAFGRRIAAGRRRVTIIGGEGGEGGAGVAGHRVKPGPGWNPTAIHNRNPRQSTAIHDAAQLRNHVNIPTSFAIAEDMSTPSRTLRNLWRIGPKQYFWQMMVGIWPPVRASGSFRVSADWGRQSVCPVEVGWP